MSQPDDLSHYIPRSLDAASKFLFWDLDVAAVGIIGLLIGIGTDYKVCGLAVGVGLAYVYNKMKSGKHPGLASHLLYWWTGMPQPNDLPNSHLRDLTG